MAKRRQPKPAAPDRYPVVGGFGPMAFGGMTGTSRLAQQARFGNWRPMIRDADAVAQYELPDVRLHSRDLVETAPVAAGAILTRVSYIVGSGLSVQSTVDIEELGISEEQANRWQSFTERRFNLWASNAFADVAGQLTFNEQMELALRSHDESGDVFMLLGRKKRNGWPFQFVTQLIEADRVSNPNNTANTQTLRHGIERAADGEPIKAHIAKIHPGAVLAVNNEWNEVPFYSPNGRRNLLHIQRAKRIGQTRGMPLLQPIISTVKQLTRYSEAEVDAAVNSAAMALFATMDVDSFRDIFSGEQQEVILANAMKWDGIIDSGKTTNLFPGQTITSPTPGRPNPNYDPFFGAMINYIAMGLNMPKDVLAKSFNASYSASRAALMDAWRTWKIERAWLVSKLCQLVYEEWLADAVAAGIINAPGFFSDPFIRAAWSKTMWTGDGPGALDPLQEADAAEKRMQIGLSSLEEEKIAYDGGDWTTTHTKRARENAKQIADGLQPVTAAPAPSAPAPALPADAPPGPRLPNRPQPAPRQ